MSYHSSTDSQEPPGAISQPNGEIMARYKAILDKSAVYYGRVRASGVQLEDVRAGEGHPFIERRSVYYSRDGHSILIRMRKAESQGAVSEAGETIIAQNKRECFKLSRKTEESPYIVQYFGKDRRPIEHDLQRFAMSFAEAPYTLHTLSIREMLSSPDFTLKDVIPGASDREPVRIVFRYDPTDPERRQNRFSGWWSAAPRDGWRLTEFDIDVWSGRQKGKMRGSVRYGEPSGDIPIPQHVEVTYTFGDYVQKHVFDFDHFALDADPESSFTLAAFGLGSLEGPSHGSDGNKVAYACFGLAALALAASVALRIAARRTRVVTQGC